jgi:phospholipase C
MKAGTDIHRSRAAGAPFNVNLRNLQVDVTTDGRAMMVATYAVKAGDTLHEEILLTLFANCRSAIDVHSSNGFYRSFTTGPELPTLQVNTAYEQKNSLLTENIQVRLRKTGERQVSVTVHDNSYSLAPYLKRSRRAMRSLSCSI